MGRTADLHDPGPGHSAAARGWWGQLIVQGTPGLKIRVRAQPSDFHVIIMMGAYHDDNDVDNACALHTSN